MQCGKTTIIKIGKKSSYNKNWKKKKHVERVEEWLPLAGLGLWGWEARMTRTQPGGHGVLQLRFLSCVSSGEEGRPPQECEEQPKRTQGCLLWPRLGVEGHPSPLHPRQAAYHVVATWI